MTANTHLSRSLATLKSTVDANGLGPALHDIASAYGVKHMTCLVVRAAFGSERFPYFCTTYAASWVDAYLQRAYFDLDPVIDIIRWGRLTVDWSCLDKTAPATERFFQEAHINGVGLNGMTVPVRGPGGERSLFSVSSDQTSPDWEATSTRIEHDILILAHYLHDQAIRTARHATPNMPGRLSRREIQCLEGLASGLLAKQIAAGLGLSESAVRLYLRSARRKLGATTSYHAVAKASYFELITI